MFSCRFLILIFIAILSFSKSAAKNERYLFFLHNKYLELFPESTPHPEYGQCEYSEIVARFRAKGLIVISEIRSKDIDAENYAHHIAHQVDSLLKKGIPAGNITIVGTSKGGYIAEYVSDILKNEQLKFVFIGCCDDELKDNPNVKYYGKILSIYEVSDQWHSCQHMRIRSGKGVRRFKEIVLHTGLRHGYLYKASDVWMIPTTEWAMSN